MDGAFTDVNGTTINDANAVFHNTASQDEQFNLIELPAGSFGIKAVKVAARAETTSGATATKLGLTARTSAKRTSTQCWPPPSVNVSKVNVYTVLEDTPLARPCRKFGLLRN